MKRWHILLVILMAISVFAVAAPLKNVEVRITQPNGQVINCFASGDEFYNYLHDAKGYTIVQGEGGYYVYATKDAKGTVIPSTYIVGSVDPAAVGLQPYVKISKDEYYARRKDREQYIRKPQMKNGKDLNHGLYNNLVVFIRFAGDTYHTSSFSTVQAMFNADDYNANSLHNYYHHTSYNQLDLWSHFFPQPDGETILSYEDIHPKQYYQPYDPVTNPIGYHDGETAEREFSMLERAINYIEDMVPDTIDLDYNGDGLVDNVVFVIKGEPGEWASLLWPHRWCIYDRYVPLHDLQVFDFNLQLEQGGYFNVSTLCHEMFHSLGAPDLYHYSDGIDPVGSWDLMCGTTEPPQQTSTWMKHKYGNWGEEIYIFELWPDAFRTYELEAVSWEGGRRNGIIIDINSNQFFFLEYRDKSNVFDSQIPGSGLLIYRIDTRFEGNASWDGHDYFDEVYLFRPGGDVNQAGEINQANFCEEMGRTTFSNTSDPKPFLTDGQFLDWEYQITNVGKTGDKISFDIRPSEGAGSGPAPQNFTANVNSLEHQVELSWSPGSVSDEGYNLFCDGAMIAMHITDTTFVHPYSESDNGYHVYSVVSVTGGFMYIYSAPSYAWAILGNYETISLEITSDSPYGTKGGELEVLFRNNPDMLSRYYTIYEGNAKTDELQVPANTEIIFVWYPGFDADGEGIHVSATHRNNQGEGEIFSIDNPTSGLLATYTVPDESMGVTAPQKTIAISEGSNIRLKWTMATEFNNFNIYRDGVLLASDVPGYEYLDDQLIHSGTHLYQVEGASPGYTTWHPENAAQATALCYYCEPPRNLQGVHYPDRNELSWEAPQFAGYGLIAYDNNVYVDHMGSGTFKWGIKINPELLQTFEGQPITHLEMYDCSAGNYKYKLYNGNAVNNNYLIYTQQKEMTGSQQMVRFPLDEAVNYDSSLPLWIAVESTGADGPAPYGAYVGEPNSCMAKIGSSWQPVVSYDYPYTWLLRAYTSPQDTNPEFTYNVYCGPKDGGTDQMTMAFENHPACTVNHTSPVDVKYCVTALWNGKETDFSNTVSLESTGLEDFDDDTEPFQATAFQIIDMMGRMVSHGAVSHDIPADNLSPGIYVLRLFNGNDVKTKKIVIREK